MKCFWRQFLAYSSFGSSYVWEFVRKMMGMSIFLLLSSFIHIHTDTNMVPIQKTALYYCKYWNIFFIDVWASLLQIQNNIKRTGNDLLRKIFACVCVCDMINNAIKELRKNFNLMDCCDAMKRRFSYQANWMEEWIYSINWKRFW